MRDFLIKKVVPTLDFIREKVQPQATDVLRVIDQETGEEIKMILSEKFNSGASASIYKGFLRTTMTGAFDDALRPFAIKRMHYKTLAPDDPDEFTKLLKRETFALESVTRCPFASKFVTKYFGHYYFPELDEHLLVMEFCDGGNLMPLRKMKPNFKQLAAIMVQLLRGLEQIHALGFIHADIKTENILMKYPGIIKICDFGLAAKVKGVPNPEFHALGTLRYMAPEQMMKNIALDYNDPSAELYKYDERIDIWSVGIILLEILIGRTPLHALRMADEDLFCKYLYRMCDLRLERNRGTALGPLFFLVPKYKKFVQDSFAPDPTVTCSDLELLKRRLPELAKNEKHMLRLLMRPGMHDKKPDPNAQLKMHAIKGLFAADKCFDFIAQCLFIDYLKRPTAKELQNHVFLRSASKEFTELEPQLGCIEEDYKHWGKRKEFWRRFRCPLTVHEVHNILEKQQKLTKERMRGKKKKSSEKRDDHDT